MNAATPKIDSKPTFNLWNKYYITMIIVSLLAGVCNQFFNSTLSLHINSMGEAAASTGAAAMLMTITSAIFRALGGRLSDTRGRRVVTVWGYLIFGVATFLFVFADSIPLIILFRSLQGIGFGLAGVSIMAAVADVVPTHRMGEGIGLFGLGNSLTQAVGPSIGLMLFYSAGGFGSVATAAAGSLFLSALIMGFCRYEKDARFVPEEKKSQPESTVKPVEPAPEGKKNVFAVMFEKSAVPASVVQLFASFASGMVMSFLTLYAASANIVNPGIFFTLSAVTIVVARLFTGKVADRFGLLFALIPGFLFGIGAFVCLILSSRNPMFYYFAGILYGFSSGMTSPVLNAEAVRGVPQQRRGAAVATFQTPMELSIALSSLVCGLFIDSLGFFFVFGLCIATFGISLILSLAFFLKKSGRTAS